MKRRHQVLKKTNELMKQTNVLIQDVALKVRQIEVNEKELDDKKNVIIENMESLKTLSDSNYSATENIVSHFKKIVNNSFGIGEKAFDVSAVHEKMNAVCEQAVLKAQGNKFTKPEILKVAYMPNYGSLCAVVPAMKLGYFEKENLKIELYEYANGLEIIKAMEEGKIDLGYIGNGAHKFCIKGRASIAIMSHLSNAEAIIGNRSHEVRTVADLRGKRIEM